MVLSKVTVNLWDTLVEGIQRGIAHYLREESPGLHLGLHWSGFLSITLTHTADVSSSPLFNQQAQTNPDSDHTVRPNKHALLHRRWPLWWLRKSTNSQSLEFFVPDVSNFVQKCNKFFLISLSLQVFSVSIFCQFRKQWPSKNLRNNMAWVNL